MIYERGKPEIAADMKSGGRSYEEIAKHFGWTILTAKSMVSRGRHIDRYRERRRVSRRAENRIAGRTR